MTLSRYHWTECKQYLGCRHPSSVSLAGSEEPSSLPASPRGKPQGGWYGFALVHSNRYSAYREPLRHAYARPSAPFRGGFLGSPMGELAARKG